MDLKQIIAAATKMFPSADLQNAVQKAEQAISGTADTLEGVQSTARRLGIDPNIANSLYARYGKTMQAKALCGLLGTTPEALRSDANKINLDLTALVRQPCCAAGAALTLVLSGVEATVDNVALRVQRI